MFRLVDQSLNSRIEDNLIRSRRLQDSWFSLGFNLVCLVVVVGGFLYFLYSSYNTPQVENKQIEYKPVPWLNAVRNVPGDQEYGQVPQTEIGGGISGTTYRSSAATF
jgi:hypothetical protein